MNITNEKLVDSQHGLVQLGSQVQITNEKLVDSQQGPVQLGSLVQG